MFHIRRIGSPQIVRTDDMHAILYRNLYLCQTTCIYITTLVYTRACPRPYLNAIRTLRMEMEKGMSENHMICGGHLFRCKPCFTLSFERTMLKNDNNVAGNEIILHPWNGCRDLWVFGRMLSRLSFSCRTLVFINDHLVWDRIGLLMIHSLISFNVWRHILTSLSIFVRSWSSEMTRVLSYLNLIFACLE